MKRIRIPLFLSIALLAILLAGCTGSLAGGSWPGITVDKDVAYVADKSYVYAVNLTNGTMVWRYPEKADAKKLFFAEPALLDGQVVAGDYANTVVAINATDGKEKWSYASAKDRYVGAPLVIDNLILAPSTDHTLYAIKPDGTRAWEFKTGDPIWAKPVSDGKTVFSASMDHNLYALNPADGSKIWAINLGAPIMYSLALSQDQKMLFVATLANKFYAVNAADGKVAWTVDTSGVVWSPVVEHEDLIFFGDQSGKIYALSTKDGSKKWGLDAGAAVVGAPAVLENGLAFPTEDKGVQAVDFNGTKLWNQPVSGKLYSNLVYTGSQLLVPVTSGDQSLLLVALNPNGTQLWAFTMPK